MTSRRIRSVVRPSRCRRLAVEAMLLAGVLATSGCGYALSGRGSFLPADIQTVGIPQLQNQSTFFNVEQVLAEKIRAEFIGRGKYQVLANETGADAVLSGTIVGISVTPVAFTESQLASRYLFTLTMKVDFTDTRSNRVLWSNDTLVFREEYDLATRGTSAVSGETFLDQERSSFDRIASDVARSVVTSILEAF